MSSSARTFALRMCHGALITSCACLSFKQLHLMPFTSYLCSLFEVGCLSSVMTFMCQLYVWCLCGMRISSYWIDTTAAEPVALTASVALCLFRGQLSPVPLCYMAATLVSRYADLHLTLNTGLAPTSLSSSIFRGSPYDRLCYCFY